MTAAERFWAKVTKTETCWLWTGASNEFGYGRFSTGGRRSPRAYAHRVAYEALVGPIPEGFTIDHLCRTPACVNPAHLEPVTHRENVRRGTGPTAVNAAKDRCIRGHPFDVANTYRRANGRRNCRSCARERVARSRVAVRPTELVAA